MFNQRYDYVLWQKKLHVFNHDLIHFVFVIRRLEHNLLCTSCTHSEIFIDVRTKTHQRLITIGKTPGIFTAERKKH